MDNIVLGSYEVANKLGEGAFGTVFTGYHRVLGRKAALKVLKTGNSKMEMESRLRYFTREAYILAQLDHDNIVAIYDAFLSEMGPCIAIEYVYGENLRITTSLTEHGYAEKVKYIVEVLAALRAAHDAGVIHRDIKPENILISFDGGNTKLSDFGIATNPDDDYLATSTTLGTMPYMAPEQLLGERPTPQSDLWSVGVVFYELMTGEPPFQGRTAAAIHKSILAGKYKPLDNAAYPKWACEFATRALQIDPDNRFRSCDEMLDILPVKLKATASADLNPEELLSKILLILTDSRVWLDKEQVIREAARLCDIRRVGRSIRHQFVKAILRGRRRGLIQDNQHGEIAGTGL